MMMSNVGKLPHHSRTTHPEQDSNPVLGFNTSTVSQQQAKRNVSKRSKEADDSFEQEHRLGVGYNQYFNTNESRFESKEMSSRSGHNTPESRTPRPSFPPFRLNIVADELPSELSIIKNLNKHCRIGLSFGRYSTLGGKKSFLIYANSSEQFDRLMNRDIWPIQLCAHDYTIDFPTKVPPSYSLVAVGIPAQWSLVEFEEDLRKQYTTIVKVERLFVRGGLPIPKVRIDFSSNQEVNKILKKKRLMIDEENTSFAVQPYTIPIKVLRCFNCQQYNDHVAAQCPFKDKPICFRCGQSHPFNPRCTNSICCANCQQDHMAGNPNCPTKIEERKKHRNTVTSSITSRPKQQYNSFPAPWSTIPNKQIVRAVDSTETFEKTPDIFNADQNALMCIANKIDILMNKVEVIAVEQMKLMSNFNNVNQRISQFNEELEMLKDLMVNQFRPFVGLVAESCLSKSNAAIKEKLRLQLTRFNDTFDATIKSKISVLRPGTAIPNPSPNESASEDV